MYPFTNYPQMPFPMAKQQKLQPSVHTPSFRRYTLVLLPLIFGIAIVYFQRHFPHSLELPNNISIIISNTNQRGKVASESRLEAVLSPVPTKRSTIFKYDARVACWPSTGGIWIKHATPVDLDFLRLSRINDTDKPLQRTYYYTTTCPILDPDIYVPPPLAEEDFFCQKLRMLGADFWDLRPGEGLHDEPIEYTIPPKYKNHLGFY